MSLIVTAAQFSDKGPKAANDDALALHLPEGFGRSSRVMIAAIADGVSSAESGGPAAMIATRSFCSDFLATDLNWSIKTAGYRVIDAINRWLHGQGQNYIYSQNTHLTTFSAVIISGQQAHIFHVGDSRVWRFRQTGSQSGNGHDALECLTKDHTLKTGYSDQLIRALGMDWRVEVDYQQVDVQIGDYFLLTTDGVHGVVSKDILAESIQTHIRADDELNLPAQTSLQAYRQERLEKCAQYLGLTAQRFGSQDNQSCQLIRIEGIELSQDDPREAANFPPLLPERLQQGQQVDGFQIIDEIHANSRSRIYHAIQVRDQQHVILKTPAAQFDDDVGALQAFTQEDWIGQRIVHSDIVRTLPPEQPRQFLYLVQEYLSGQTLRQWRQKNPNVPVETVIQYIRPAVRALRALHRRETLHQDVKPDNFMVLDEAMHGQGRLKLIDFGSAQVGSVSEKRIRPGAMEYAAPEYALDQAVDARADQFALAVTFYEVLTGKLPYGDGYVTAQKAADFAKLSYVPASVYNPHVPLWVDAALMKACSLDAKSRYEDLGEWQADMERPNFALVRPKIPLMEQYPVRFWQTVAGLLLLGNIAWLVLWLK